MATSLDKDQVNLSRQQLGYSQEFTDELNKQVNLANQLFSTFSLTNDRFKSLAQTISGVTDSISDLKSSIEKQLEAIKEQEKVTSRYAQLNEGIKKSTEKFNSDKTSALNIQNNLTGKAQQLAKDYVDGLTARYKIDEKINDLASKRQALQEAQKTGVGVNEARKEFIAAGLVVRQLKQKLETVKQVNEGQGHYLKGLNEDEKKQLMKFGVLQKQMDVSRNYVRNHQDELNILEKQLTPWQKIQSYAKHYMEELQKFPGVKASLAFIQTQLNTIGIDFKSILNNVLKLDSLLVNFGKSVQVSKEGARTLADAFEVTSDNAANYNNNVSAAQANIKQQIEANNTLNESLGTGALFLAKTRLDQIELVKGMGLQAETGAKLYQLGLLNQKSAHQVTVEIGDQVVNLRKSTGITLDYRKVLTDVSKISGQLAVQYKNNPELLAKAVIQAKELGLTLEQTARMGEKLLDFPGSIESELKAELLTGKALNLEQARYLALMGDSAGAAKELMNNVGGLSEFQKLNVIQQKALAEAVGMQVDELSNALTQQELLKGTAYESEAAFKEAAQQAARTGDYTKLNAELAQAANGEQLAQQAAQIGNQEKFQMAIEKLQISLANMVNGPLGKMIDKFANLVSQAGTLKFILGTIAGIIGIKMVSGLVSLGKAVASVIPKFAALAAEATFTNALLTFGVGVAVAAAAAAIGYGIINSLSDGEANVNGSASESTAIGGGVNVPRESSKPIVVEVKNQNSLVVNNRVAQEMNTQNTIVASSKVDR